MIRAIIPIAALAAAAQAQSGEWIVEVRYEPGSGGVVSPAHPTATVRIWAGFSGLFAFAVGNGDLHATDGDWGLNPVVPPGAHPPGSLDVLLPVGNPVGPPPPGTSGGFARGSSVEDFLMGVIYFPPGMPDRRNPIPLWQALWTTSDFTARGVELSTANTTRFSLYDVQGQQHPVTPTHDSAIIRVIPAPGTPAVLVATLLAVARGRRGREETPR